MAFDAQSNLWIANGAGVNEFNSFGAELSPASGFTNSGISGIAAVGIDSANNVWIGDTLLFSELTNPGGELIVNSLEGGASAMVFPQLAADGSGDIWGALSPESDAVCKIPPYGGLGTTVIPTCYEGGLPLDAFGYTPIGAFPQGIALDGAGSLWIASQGGAVTARDTQGNYEGAGDSLPIPDVGNVGTLRVAVDGSGNVWVLLANNTVIEHIGAATPVVMPIALGVKNNKLAAKP